MRALVLLLALSTIFPALATPAFAGEVLASKSAEPTCATHYSNHWYNTPYGFETYFRVPGHKGLFHRNCDYLGNPDAPMSDIAMPLNYSDMVNTTGVPKETHPENAYIAHGRLILR